MLGDVSESFGVATFNEQEEFRHDLHKTEVFKVQVRTDSAF
jgi:hypothetical protein